MFGSYGLFNEFKNELLTYNELKGPKWTMYEANHGENCVGVSERLNNIS